MIHSRRKPLAAVSLLMLLAWCGGCASSGEKMVDSYMHTRELVDTANRQVDITLSNLAYLRIAPPSNLNEAFDQYKEAVGLLDEQAKTAKDHSAAMQAEADAHVKSWQKEMETIQDPTIKASMESRRQAVQSNFQLVRMYADDARKAYEPFLRGNQQLIQAISIDRSPATIASLGQSIDKVYADGGTLKQKLAALRHALDNIANGVSPLGNPR
jgi:hypothetical protein